MKQASPYGFAARCAALAGSGSRGSRSCIRDSNDIVPHLFESRIP